MEFNVSMGMDFQRGDIANKKTNVGFAAAKGEKVEELFREQTVGLQTKQSFVDKRKEIEETLEKEAAARVKEHEEAALQVFAMKRKKNKKVKAASTSKLSFADEEEEGWDAEDGDGEGAEPPSKFGKFGKNPSVKTDFLPDRDRDIVESRAAIVLKEEYKEAIKIKMAAEFTLHFVYWKPRGSELRDIKKVKHTMVVKYGDNLSDLLARFRDANHKQYYELAHITGEQCLFAKEGLIIPHHFTWFELLQRGCEVFGKNIFDFDAPPPEIDPANFGGAGESKFEDGVAKPGDWEETDQIARKFEKKKTTLDAMKLSAAMTMPCVLDRKWFDKNRKTFPMVKWEVFNPKKDYRKVFVGDPGPAVVNTEHVS
mmetsp:Transcript_23555/g.57709  ORF Transcript_23555/g.57709 Transcript_23555/m.57709 type:complete len:369 (+) Transcript_23555:123-1229(+)